MKGGIGNRGTHEFTRKMLACEGRNQGQDVFSPLNIRCQNEQLDECAIKAGFEANLTLTRGEQGVRSSACISWPGALAPHFHRP